MADLGFELSLSASKACAFSHFAFLLLVISPDAQSSLESRAGSRWPVDLFYRKVMEVQRSRMTGWAWSQERPSSTLLSAGHVTKCLGRDTDPISQGEDRGRKNTV